MPWYNGDCPPSYKNQSIHICDKATEIANEILKESCDEGIAIATGLKSAREYFAAHPEVRKKGVIMNRNEQSQQLSQKMSGYTKEMEL